MQSDTYHHGDLPNALRAAAADLLAERGVGGFSLREVARRAGVSHAAPAHHFGDAGGLLTSVAVEGFMHLATRTEAAAAAEADDPVEAMAGIARAYVELAAAHPGHAAVMFRDDVVDCLDVDYQSWADRALGALTGAVERLAAERVPGLDIDLAVTTCWSMVQGLVDLYPTLERITTMAGVELDAIGDRAERQARLVVAGLLASGAG